jgi:glyoxylase-like metal-dependent hydrolase (beta-lactamase superfamily II)
VTYLPADARSDRPILAAILGAEDVLMVDAGASPAHAQLFLDELHRLTKRLPSWVALTHWHWDHTFGLSHLSAPAIAHHNAAKNLAQQQGLSWGDDALAERVKRGTEIAFCAEHIAKEYGPNRDIRVVLPTITFEGAVSVDLGGVVCELHHIPTDHTDDAVAVYVPEEGVLFLGDAMGENLYADPPYYSAPGVDALIKAIEQFPSTWYVESHSQPADANAFWAENAILPVVAGLISEGLTARHALISATKRRLGDRLPADHQQVIDLFLRSL